jgi:hypothetical protein
MERATVSGATCVWEPTRGLRVRRLETRSRAQLSLLQGTWEMGERAADRASKVAALRLGFDPGLAVRTLRAPAVTSSCAWSSRQNRGGRQ